MGKASRLVNCGARLGRVIIVEFVAPHADAEVEDPIVIRTLRFAEFRKFPAKKSDFCSETEYEIKYGAGSAFSFRSVKLRSISCLRMSSRGAGCANSERPTALLERQNVARNQNTNLAGPHAVIICGAARSRNPDSAKP